MSGKVGIVVLAVLMLGLGTFVGYQAAMFNQYEFQHMQFSQMGPVWLVPFNKRTGDTRILSMNGKDSEGVKIEFHDAEETITPIKVTNYLPSRMQPVGP
ncbi:MAG: hypothetical protein H6818_05675 [Phycisphaerales bacterium]|nr:hypothetical protein [Phycisphaerales bacterium]MCB9862752.1 hypothetical protein [Phycisphaerales bacterium]